MGSFIAHLRTGTAPLIHSVCEAVLYYLSQDFNQAGWDPSQGTQEQVLPHLSILFVKLFYYLPEDLKQTGWDPSQGTKEQEMSILSILFVKLFYIIYQKISNNLAGMGSFIAHLRKGTAV